MAAGSAGNPFRVALLGHYQAGKAVYRWLKANGCQAQNDPSGPWTLPYPVGNATKVEFAFHDTLNKDLQKSLSAVSDRRLDAWMLFFDKSDIDCLSPNTGIPAWMGALKQHQAQADLVFLIGVERLGYLCTVDTQQAEAFGKHHGMTLIETKAVGEGMDKDTMMAMIRTMAMEFVQKHKSEQTRGVDQCKELLMHSQETCKAGNLKTNGKLRHQHEQPNITGRDAMDLAASFDGQSKEHPEYPQIEGTTSMVIAASFDTQLQSHGEKERDAFPEVPTADSPHISFDKASAGDGTEVFKILDRSRQPLSWREVIEMWKNYPEFAVMFSQTLAASHHQAFFWETVHFTRSTLQKPFEMVLVDAPGLAHTRPNPSQFRDNLVTHGQGSIAVFLNLGRDALLVSPCRIGRDNSPYGHLASFVRDAPEQQKVEFWSTLAEAIENRLMEVGEEPMWVSTSGLGVPWLHVRLDSRPKYYQHMRFRNAGRQADHHRGGGLWGSLGTGSTNYGSNGFGGHGHGGGGCEHGQDAFGRHGHGTGGYEHGQDEPGAAAAVANGNAFGGRSRRSSHHGHHAGTYSHGWRPH
ncbi:unnamed protein product [Ostreobium quekettii]|uniref:Uncharacterized protein n=1 Tax=Ostreobium quekettii TaxID=121088 RepID=A0A8S1IUZ5_9CHLO|nr:unnamed protein product [Ostreobium quekettii]